MTRASIVRLIVLPSIAFLVASCASSTAASSPTPAATEIVASSTPALVMPRGMTPTPSPVIVWPTATPTEEGIAEVEVGDYFFEPQVVTITLGTMVRWRAVGDLHHSILSKDSPSVFEGGTGGSGSRPFTFTFRSPGTYAYYCDYHPGEMNAWIVVVEDD